MSDLSLQSLRDSIRQERVDAVQSFGFTERQARFLVYVLVHSGVFLERQYRTCAHIAHGQKTHNFLAKLVGRGYAKAITPGALTFEVNRRLVDDVVLVTDRQILDAMRFLFERMKVVAEPSGAVGVAALIDGRILCANKRVGVIVSGGNIAAERLARLLAASDKET